MTQVLDSDDFELTEDELAALAMAADPDAPIDPDAVPFGAALEDYPELLPSWYMPSPGGFSRSRRRAAIVVLIICALLAINACGLCITSGHIEIPF